MKPDVLLKAGIYYYW